MCISCLAGAFILFCLLHKKWPILSLIKSNSLSKILRRFSPISYSASMRHFWGAYWCATSLSYLNPKQVLVSTYHISERVQGWLLTCFVHGLLIKNYYSGRTGHIKIWGAFQKFHKVPQWGALEAHLRHLLYHKMVK